MLNDSEHELLQAIYNEMQELKKAVQVKDERRVTTQEFAERMGFCERTLWARISAGKIKPGYKDGRLNYWSNSYVNSVVTQALNSDKVAA